MSKPLVLPMTLSLAVEREIRRFDDSPAWAEVDALRAALAAAEAKLAEWKNGAVNDACGDALELLWRDVILVSKPDYGPWEYTAQAYRHLLAEFADLRAKLADAEKHADELAEALESVKWVQPMYNGSPSCSWCGNQEHLHKVECGLDKLVAAHAARRASRDGQEGTR